MVDLTTVATHDLERFAKALESGRVSFPLSRIGLSAVGVVADALLGLNPLGRDGALALVRAVQCERASAPRPPQLVWTGPDGRSSGARDTAVVLASLVSQAQQRVLLVGFTFDHAGEVLRPLWDAMRRGVEARVFADGAAATLFSTSNWPFGPPAPKVFAFQPPVGVFASLHAKCVVVDGRHTLITSANFTDRGQTRNVEVGVLLDDVALAESIEFQFQPGPQFR